jgi:hypothetical protein
MTVGNTDFDRVTLICGIGMAIDKILEQLF